MTSIESFEHVYVPATVAGKPTLLLLHGTGGDENDLLPLGDILSPGSAVLSPRGNVLEHGMPRFFKRLAEGVFDLEDLKFRTAELHEFLDYAAKEYGFPRDSIIAAGFSNGANIAASLLLSYPQSLRGGILFAPMIPFEPNPLPKLNGAPVFIGAGRADTIIPPSKAERLIEVLEASGAKVTATWHPGGHSLDRKLVQAATQWMADLQA